VSTPSLARWTPDRSPSRRDVWLFGSAAFLGWLTLSESAQAAWPWAVVGFGVTALAVGPLSETGFSQRVAAVVRAFGHRGERAVALALVFLLAIAFIWTVPDDIGRAVAGGGCAFLALSLVANAVPVARARLAGRST